MAAIIHCSTRVCRTMIASVDHGAVVAALAGGLAATDMARADVVPQRWEGPLGMEFVVVGAPGNEADEYDVFGDRHGRVDYTYSISSYEVSNRQYAAFLNSVSAHGDPHGLWHPATQGWFDEIVRFDNCQGGYYYEVVPGKEDNPVVRVNHRSIFRMMNWLHNGMQDDLSSTDSGAYDTSKWGYDERGYFTDSLAHEPGAKFWLSSHDEWYKAAYFDPDRYGEGQPGYWRFPTGHETDPDVWDEPGADPYNSAVYVTPFSEPGGSVPLTMSPWGAFDMAGNATEYVAQWDLLGLPYGSAYVIRGSPFIGGSSLDEKYVHSYAFAFNENYSGDGADWDYHSFRIVTYLPAPGTLLVLGAAGTWCATRQKRKWFR